MSTKENDIYMENLREMLEQFNDHLFDADMQNKLPIPNLDRMIRTVGELQ